MLTVLRAICLLYPMNKLYLLLLFPLIFACSPGSPGENSDFTLIREVMLRNIEREKTNNNEILTRFNSLLENDPAKTAPFFERAQTLNKETKKLVEELEAGIRLIETGNQIRPDDFKQFNVDLEIYRKAAGDLFREDLIFSSQTQHASAKALGYMHSLQEQMNILAEGKSSTGQRFVLYNASAVIHRTHGILLNELIESINRKDFRFDGLTLVAIPGEPIVKVGETTEVKVLANAFNHTFAPKAFIGKYDLKNEKVISRDDSLSITAHGGSIVYTIVGDKPGEHEVQLIGEYTLPGQEKVHRAVTIKYKVVP